MSNTIRFDWVDFYEELARKLLQYKENRKELITKVREIYETTDITCPMLEKDNQIVDIDPFTVFALFNKNSMTKLNREKLISAVAKLFDVAAPVPTSFDSLPGLDNRNAVFYRFIGERDDGDIDSLWNLFESVLAYADNPTLDNRDSLSIYFDKAINMKYNGKSKITMGMYWIAPNSFLNLDSRNTWYIYESGKLPEKLVESLPAIVERIPASDYFDITEKLRSYLQSTGSKMKDFKELSFEAWRYSQEVNEETSRKKVQAHNGTKDVSVADEEQEITYPPYDAEEFLQEVYMDKESYHILAALVKNKKNVILQGAPGVGKTYAAKRLAYSIMGVKNQERVMMVQFHQSYSYEDFIMGFRPAKSGFKRKTGAFYNFCKMAEKDGENDYFFIIDEINRGNLSKIFGELFMLIESDKRGMELQLLYKDEKFFVPSNVYIIGTMNTADRSLAMLDYALRRRFAFYEMEPGFDTAGFQKYRMGLNSPKFDKLIGCVQNLNELVEKEFGKGFCIGHSYFCNLDEATEQALSGIIEYELIPLLREYWFDEPQNIEEWTDNLRSAIK